MGLRLQTRGSLSAGASLLAKTEDPVASRECWLFWFQLHKRPKQQLNQATKMEKNRLENTSEMYLTVILRAILHKEGIEKEW